MSSMQPTSTTQSLSTHTRHPPTPHLLVRHQRRLLLALLQQPCLQVTRPGHDQGHLLGVAVSLGRLHLLPDRLLVRLQEGRGRQGEGGAGQASCGWRADMHGRGAQAGGCMVQKHTLSGCKQRTAGRVHVCMPSSATGRSHARSRDLTPSRAALLPPTTSPAATHHQRQQLIPQLVQQAPLAAVVDHREVDHLGARGRGRRAGAGCGEYKASNSMPAAKLTLGVHRLSPCGPSGIETYGPAVQPGARLQGCSGDNRWASESQVGATAACRSALTCQSSYISSSCCPRLSPHLPPCSQLLQGAAAELPLSLA